MMDAALPGSTIPDEKLEPLKNLHDCAKKVKKLAAKVLGSGYYKGIWHAREWNTEMLELGKNIDRAVGDLTLAELRQQGADAMKAQQAAADFNNTILMQQDDLKRQVFEALEAKHLLSGADVARLGAVVGEKLAALEERSGANADAVAAAVAALLARPGVDTDRVQAAVREELVVTAQVRCVCAVPLVARMVLC